MKKLEQLYIALGVKKIIGHISLKRVRKRELQ